MISSVSRKALRGYSAQYRCFSNVSDLYKRAQAAIADTSQPPRDVSNETKLKMYGYFKQIETGPCTTPRPGMFELVNRAKHDAWSKLGSLSKEDAMAQYVSLVTELFDGKLPEVKTAGDKSTSAASPSGTATPTKKVTVASIAFPKLQDPTDFSNLKLSTVAFEKVSEGVQQVILNRPKRGNAFDMALWEDYQRAFKAVDASPETRVVILTGAGGNFSTGMDLSVFAEMQSSGSKESCEGRRREGINKFIQYLQDGVSAPENCAVPVIAAVSGNCIGGAIDIITACDLRYCTKDASFCVKEIDLAIVSCVDVDLVAFVPTAVFIFHNYLPSLQTASDNCLIFITLRLRTLVPCSGCRASSATSAPRS